MPISPDRSLDRGFANNGVVARGPFFRWRLDTHRIYILLLLLGKRSSAERLFNTTRSLARSPSGLFYDRGPPPPSCAGPSLLRPDKSPELQVLTDSLHGSATKIEARPGPREWVAGIVNNRPVGRSLSGVHGAILSSPPASEDYRCPRRLLLNRFRHPASLHVERLLMSEVFVELNFDSHLRDARYMHFPNMQYRAASLNKYRGSLG